MSSAAPYRIVRCRAAQNLISESLTCYHNMEMRAIIDELGLKGSDGYMDLTSIGYSSSGPVSAIISGAKKVPRGFCHRCQITF